VQANNPQSEIHSRADVESKTAIKTLRVRPLKRVWGQCTVNSKQWSV